MFKNNTHATVSICQNIRNKASKISIILTSLFSFVLAAEAQNTGLSGGLTNVSRLVVSTNVVALYVVSLLYTISFIAFVSIVIMFIWKRRSGDANGLEQAREMLWWSVFALFVMTAVWGITFFISSNLGVGLGGCAPKPSPIPGQVVQDDCLGTTGSVIRSGSTGGTSVPSTGNQNTSVSPPSSGNYPVGTVRAANGDVLSVPNGTTGQECMQGTCAVGYYCKINDPVNSLYGTCVSTGGSTGNGSTGNTGSTQLTPEQQCEQSGGIWDLNVGACSI